MKILVLNCGSSSLKYQLIDMDNESVLAKGLCERIGIEGSKLTHKPTGKDQFVVEKPMKDHQVAVELVLEALQDQEHGVISSPDEISAIGHRVLHGGTVYSDSIVVDEDVKRVIRECFDLGPLHNPANLIGIEACEAAMPGKKNVAVFDTAFGMAMPEKAYIYPIPYEYYEKYKIRKYGAHGTSHKFVSQRVAEIMNKPIEDLKIISCHLGQGASLCAVKDGKSMDTSMGLTPLAGLPMVTRSGDLDPSVVTFIMKKENLDAQTMEDILNKKSGLASISGMAPDFRVIEDESNKGTERAKIAIEQFNYSIASFIAKYAVAMKGIDYIIFTGGIGENQINIRKGICEKLEFMGVKLDLDANNMRGEEKVISTPDSKVKVYVIPTNEELMIAKETKRLVK